MIITIALGVMLGLFLTALVGHVLSEPGYLTAIGWTVGIVVTLIVLLELPPRRSPSCC